MYKYRRLNREELELLRDSFIRFLAAQSITSEDWKKIQQNDEERDMALIDQFSDVVIEKTLHNVKILEQRNSRRLLFYEFFEQEIRLSGMEFEQIPPMDLTGEFPLDQFEKILQNRNVKYSLIRGHKRFDKDRLREIFNIMNQGATIPANDHLFNLVLKISKNLD